MIIINYRIKTIMNTIFDFYEIEVYNFLSCNLFVYDSL